MLLGWKTTVLKLCKSHLMTKKTLSRSGRHHSITSVSREEEELSQAQHSPFGCLHLGGLKDITKLWIQVLAWLCAWCQVGIRPNWNVSILQPTWGPCAMADTKKTVVVAPWSPSSQAEQGSSPRVTQWDKSVLGRVTDLQVCSKDWRRWSFYLFCYLNSDCSVCKTFYSGNTSDVLAGLAYMLRGRQGISERYLSPECRATLWSLKQ